MISLRHRRFRGDVIEEFKMIQGIDQVNLGKFLCLDKDGGTRKHSSCLKIRRHVLKYWIKVFH